MVRLNSEKFQNFGFSSLNCHFSRKIRKMITRVNSWILTKSPYIWFSRFFWNGHTNNGCFCEKILRIPEVHPSYNFFNFFLKNGISNFLETQPAQENLVIFDLIETHTSLKVKSIEKSTKKGKWFYWICFICIWF